MEPEERRFHLLHAALLLTCFLVDPMGRACLGEAWRPPALSIYPAAAALIWLAAWVRRRLLEERARRRVLEDRLQRLERRLAELERDATPTR